MAAEGREGEKNQSANKIVSHFLRCKTQRVGLTKHFLCPCAKPLGPASPVNPL